MCLEIIVLIYTVKYAFGSGIDINGYVSGGSNNDLVTEMSVLA